MDLTISLDDRIAIRKLVSTMPFAKDQEVAEFIISQRPHATPEELKIMLEHGLKFHKRNQYIYNDLCGTGNPRAWEDIWREITYKVYKFFITK